MMDTLAELPRLHARERPDQEAMLNLNDGRTWSFADVDVEANRVAQALLELGISPQERVAYLDKNAPEYFLLLYGGAKINAVSVAVNWRLAPPEMEYVVNDSQAKVLVIGDEFLPHLAQMNLKHDPRIVVLGDPANTGHPTWDQWLANAEAVDPDIAVSAEDVCYQLYTSGTTGFPKGVELTHANFLHGMRESLQATGFNPGSVNLVCMPLFHISGSGWGVMGNFWGARTVLLREVDLPMILRAIPEQKITHALFVPAVLQFLLATPGVEEADFSTLEMITYGASPITEEVLVQAINTFGCGFVQGYGLTETTGAICALEAGDHDPGGPRAHLLRSCGKPVANHEVKVVNADTTEALPDGEVGEIWVKGPQNMKGYWQNPEATAEAFEGEWFKTGDAGYLADGYVFIQDRVKDMIISGGENVYPTEIENVLMRHDGIADAAVIGVPDERWGETVKAIVTRQDPELTEQAVMEYCRGQLATYKCPTSVDWLDAIPRNPSGKILKVELRKPYWEGRERQV